MEIDNITSAYLLNEYLGGAGFQIPMLSVYDNIIIVMYTRV